MRNETDILALLPDLNDILRNNPGWLDEGVDTKEAARITGVPKDTLTTMRSRGGGPIFTQPRGTRLVRYLRRHLYQWLLSGGLMRHTNDPG